jgi:hypothetical protein
MAPTSAITGRAAPGRACSPAAYARRPRKNLRFGGCVEAKLAWTSSTILVSKAGPDADADAEAPPLSQAASGVASRVQATATDFQRFTSPISLPSAG